MKLKYYLRGLGIGLIVTTILLTVSNSLRNTDAEYKAQPDQNETTGSVIAFTTAAQTQSETQSETQATTAAPVQPTTVSVPPAEPTTQETEPEQTEPGRTATITVKDVYYASQAADLLLDAGIIEDKKEFIQYMQDSGYATKIKEGIYEIQIGETYENIAKIITRTK